MGQQLGWYITDTRAILNDRLGMFTDRDQLIRWINQGRRQVAKVTGCLSVLVPGNAPLGSVSNPGTGSPGGMVAGADPGSDSATGFFTIPNVEKYPFAFANDYLRQYNAGFDIVHDVEQIAVAWSSTFRPALNWCSWDDMQAYLRGATNFMYSYPSVWSTLGDGETGNVFLYPPPSLATEMEWLVRALPTYIYTDDDYDAIPDPFNDAVKYWAARMSYLSSQRWMQADGMEAAFYRHLGIDRPAVDGSKSSQYYWSSF